MARLKTSIFSGCLLTLVTACATTPEQGVTTVHEMQTVEHLFMPNENSPTVVMRLVFKNGSAQDPKGKEGLAVLTANMLAEGGSESFSYKELIEKFYPMAASLNFHCDKEVTTLIGEVPSEKFSQFYPLLREVILQPRFAVEDFTRIQADQINYLKSTLRGNNDEELGKWTLQTTLYAAHPYGHVDQGTVQSVQQLTLQDVEDFYRDNYTQDRLYLGIAGNYPANMEMQLLQDFQQLPDSAQQALASLPEAKEIQGQQVIVVQKEAPATAISIGFPLAINRADDDFYALLIANSAFGEHRTFNGRLMNHMRGLRGLNYGDYSYIENFIQEGGSTFPIPNIPRSQQYFSIWIRPVPHDKALFAIRQAIRELRLLIDEGLTPEEFAATKKFLVNYSKLWVQTLSRSLGYAMDGKFYGTESLVAEIQERLPEISLEQVNQAIKKHLQTQDLWIAVVTKDAESLRDALLAEQPSPITYDTEGTPEEILQEDKIIESFPLQISGEIAIKPVGMMFEAADQQAISQ